MQIYVFLKVVIWIRGKRFETYNNDVIIIELEVIATDFIDVFVTPIRERFGQGPCGNMANAKAKAFQRLLENSNDRSLVLFKDFVIRDYRLSEVNSLFFGFPISSSENARD
jgi:hypothetical protein